MFRQQKALPNPDKFKITPRHPDRIGIYSGPEGNEVSTSEYALVTKMSKNRLADKSKLCDGRDAQHKESLCEETKEDAASETRRNNDSLY